MNEFSVFSHSYMREERIFWFHFIIINPPTSEDYFKFLIIFFTLPSSFSMKSTAYLTLIMTINWIFEIISFYNETSSTFFDIINALQGIFIFFMFICLPRPMKFIKYWWKDRGSILLDSSSDTRAKATTTKTQNNNEIQMSLLKQ